MALPKHPITFPPHAVTLTVPQIEALTGKLAELRHDINGSLSLIVAAMELRSLNPQKAEQLLNKVSEQPQKITDHLKRFSAEFEQAFGIKRS
jgi:hypothetical protein